VSPHRLPNANLYSTAGPVGQLLHPLHRRGALPRGTFKDGADGGTMPKNDAERPSPESNSFDDGQSVVEAGATPTENFASSRAEALEESSEARRNAFYKNWWERRRKLLPKLKLKYPDDDEQGRIAQLAGVENTLRFAEGIRSIILDAHLSNQQFHTLSVPEVRSLIDDVAKQAENLKSILTQLDVGSGSEGSFMKAGYLLERELCASASEMTQLPEYMVMLDALNTAAQRAVDKPISFPRGAGGNPAFDMFIEQLLITTQMHGGHWTIYRSTDQRWAGNLLQGLKILEKYLPQMGFLPPGDLGRPVEHIREKLFKELARFPGLGRSQ